MGHDAPRNGCASMVAEGAFRREVPGVGVHERTPAPRAMPTLTHPGPLRFEPRRAPLLRRALVVLLLASAACGADPHRGDGRLQIAWELEDRTPPPGPVRVVVQVTEMDWTPRNGLRVTVRARSPDGEVTSWPAPGEGAGRYVAEGVALAEPGPWTVTARAERPDGRWTERDVTVTVGGG